MTKAVVFDFFGVLAVKGVKSFRKTFFPDDPIRMEKAGQLSDELGLGHIGYDEYIDQLAQLAATDRQTVLEYTEDYQPNKELLDYIRTYLKPKFKLGIISNAGADWVAKILGEDVELFDDIVLSYKAGFIKPDAQIYKVSAKNLGIEPEEAVFTDDILTYCQGAEAVGMKSVWYKDFAQMKTELEKVLATNPNN